MNSTLKSKKWFPPDISDSLERFIPKKTTSISNPNPVTPIIVLIRATATHLMRLSLVMKHKNWLFALLIIGCSFDVQAQSFITKEADRAMQDLDYVTAINLYQQILLRESDNNGIKIKLADCYRQINDTENAERWYAESIRSKDAKPVHRLYYGMMLQANGKCDKAKAWFTQYTADKPDDVRGQHLALACDAKTALMEAGKGIYTVQHLPVNSNMDDFAPTIRGNQLLFSSEREEPSAVRRTSQFSGNPFAELYVSIFDASADHPAKFHYDEVKKFGKHVNSKYHEASIAFSPDGQTLFFTRNSFLNGKTGRSETGLLKLKIYTASADVSETQQTMQELPFCSNEYNTAHPSLNADGKRLYFSSNKPGGYGGMDLYVSEWEGGRWGMPINLGPDINTEGNEIFPYISPDSRLYFASNSHVGLGGLDIYYATPKGKGDWNTPVNLGAPINSTGDDFGISFSENGSWGVFTSNRTGGKGGDDLYGFTKSAVPVEIMVTDAIKKTPLKGAAVTNKTTGFTMISGPEGKIFLDMRTDECAEFLAEKKGYDSFSLRACSQNVGSGQLLRVNMSLEKKADFMLQGVVFDEADGLPMEAVRVIMSNDCGRPIEIAQTGADGRFRFSLDKKCCYNIKAELEEYLPDTTSNHCTDQLEQGAVLRTELSLRPAEPGHQGVSSLAGMENWRRSDSGQGYLINVYYNSEQAQIREESKPELDRLLKTLQQNPSLLIEIAAHTDARGEDEYNMNLSQHRAEAVVAWLVGKGIDRARLKAKGYGETRPVNGCTNGIPCSEEMHQMNRRTEFHILNGTNGANGKG